jgi:hypothetical protein
MQSSLQLILSSTKLQSTSEELKAINSLLPEITDWEALTHLLIGNTCAPLVYKKVQSLPNAALIPKESLALLRKAYYTTVSRSSLMYAEFGKVVQMFQQNDIHFIALKGIYLCEWLYQDIGLRLFSDIDLLVKAEDTTKAMQLLTEMGYFQHDPVHGLSNFVDAVSTKEGLDFTHFEAFTKNNISIEIHLKLSPDKHKDKYNLDIPEMFHKSVVATFNSQQISVLHPYDLLIHIAIHTDLHFRHGQIQFTCFNDLVNLLERFKTDFNWDEFIARCKQFNCEKAVFTHLLVVNKYYKAYLPPVIIEKYAYLPIDTVENQFLSYLKGETYKIVSKTAVGGHLNSLKSIRSVPVLLRYLKEVLFPSKEFMIEKYLNQFTMHNAQCIIKEEESQTSTNTLTWAKIKKKLCILGRAKRQSRAMHYQLCIKYWWLWYPYRWYCGIKGLFYIITKTNHVLKPK